MAGDTVFVVGWNRAVTGREKYAMELFQEALGTYAGWQREGKIESFEPVLLDAHGGDLNGFIVLRGEFDKLHGLKNLDKWIDLNARASYCIQDFGVVEGAINAGLQKRMTLWNKVISQ